MPLPDQTPKLPKIPFLIGDGALLAAAWLIADRAPHPLPIEHTLAIAGCVICAAVIGVVPFLTDYARRQDEALDDRQRGLEALAGTVTTSAEQISIAAQGLQEITALAQRSLQEADQLPRKLQEKLAELQPRTEGVGGGEKQKADKELSAVLGAKAERLEAVAEQIAKAATEWARSDSAVQKMLATWEKFADDPQKARKQADPEAPAEAPAVAAPSLTLDFPEPVAVAKPARKPRKPKAEPAPEPAAPVLESAAEISAASEPSDFAQLSPEEAAPAPAVSADGSTRLLVTAYIGIGNRLFIRGDGPGLSWEKGVPLQFVSIGKWRWESADAASPVRFKLYKNDEIECAALGEVALEPGRQQELTAGF